MRPICVFAVLLPAMVLVPDRAPAQAMIEHAVAAAGGSAAGAAGKPVSEGVSKIFENLGKVQKKAERYGERTQPVQPADPPQAGMGDVPPLAAASPGTFRPQVRHAPTGYISDPPPNVPQGSSLAVLPWSSEATPPPPAPTRDDMQEVHTGDSRANVVAQLGRPSARVLIPGEGELEEVYFYAGRGRHLGTVRLSDGKVNTVVVNGEPE